MTTDHKTVREALQSADRYMSVADHGVMTAQRIKKALAALDRIEATTAEKNKAALERAFELLDRIETQCKAVGHPVGGIGELKAICSQALTTTSVPQEND